ncbi:hypothetical protein SS37A_01460 [Methylocystis iwaonis]|uniref:Uncharacterized protein n=1 Tax=Methylocystis iwaonis TaxID=2885079 RepID=A0ABN6VBH9_9HYPH|nr:hypothetical protein SS37A_01460 [Methylocystis iwaonis]
MTFSGVGSRVWLMAALLLIQKERGRKILNGPVCGICKMLSNWRAAFPWFIGAFRAAMIFMNQRVIASDAKQSRAAVAALDCFVAALLAMTVVTGFPPLP